MHTLIRKSGPFAEPLTVVESKIMEAALRFVLSVVSLGSSTSLPVGVS
jgi:hypothetical protein